MMIQNNTTQDPPKTQPIWIPSLTKIPRVILICLRCIRFQTRFHSYCGWTLTLFCTQHSKEGWHWNFSSSFHFDDLSTCPRAPLDICLSTSNNVLSLSINIKSMIKQWWRIAYYTIFMIPSASILLEIPSKFFGWLCSPVYFPLINSITLSEGLWIESHTNNTLGYPTNG